MGRAVGEEVVNEHADEREQEDDQAPYDFVQRWAVRLDDLDCSRVSMYLHDPYKSTDGKSFLTLYYLS